MPHYLVKHNRGYRMMLASFDINTTSVSSRTGIDSSSIAPGFTPVCREVCVARSSYFRERYHVMVYVGKKLIKNIQKNIFVWNMAKYTYFWHKTHSCAIYCKDCKGAIFWLITIFADSALQIDFYAVFFMVPFFMVDQCKKIEILLK